MQEISANNVDKVVCCGDIVGYGPQPNECIELLANTKNISMIVGNHDEAVIGGARTDITRFNHNAKAAVDINRSVITERNLGVLKALPERHIEEDALFIHGSPRDPLNEYMFLLRVVRENAGFFDEKICFCGHTHSPMIFSRGIEGKETFDGIEGEQLVDINPALKYIVNVGSVGQPRDGDNRACFVYYDTIKNTLLFRRLAYDIAKTQAKMKELSLPEFLIMRLAEGE